ncbi:MAG: hypothetical protein FJZ79_04585 [Chlorobi bacterium]|nr:hypothetical protein [Chlorobiota bacterium]
MAENMWLQILEDAERRTLRPFPILTSRDCPHTCKMCVTPEIYHRKYFAIDPELLGEQIAVAERIVEFSRQSGAVLSSLNFAVPLPGTKFFSEQQAKGNRSSPTTGAGTTPSISCSNQPKALLRKRSRKPCTTTSSSSIPSPASRDISWARRPSASRSCPTSSPRLPCASNT